MLYKQILVWLGNLSGELFIVHEVVYYYINGIYSKIYGEAMLPNPFVGVFVVLVISVLTVYVYRWSRDRIVLRR